MSVHPSYRNPRRRRQLYTLIDSAFPGLAAKIDTARALGFDWDPVTTPFVHIEDDVIVSHVGVLDVPLRLDGAAVRVAGVHAVCTQADQRRRGHFRRAMEQALQYIDQRWDLAELHTGQPSVYEPFGFVVVPTVRWRAMRPARPVAPPPATIDPVRDLPALIEALARRTPVSDVYAGMDDGWLFGIDAVLHRGDLSAVFALPQLGVFVAGQLDGQHFTLFDVVGPALPTWPDLAAQLPGTGPIDLALCPDRFPEAHAQQAGPSPDGQYMVRGRWPTPKLPLAVPTFAQH